MADHLEELSVLMLFFFTDILCKCNQIIITIANRKFFGAPGRFLQWRIGVDKAEGFEFLIEFFNSLNNDATPTMGR